MKGKGVTRANESRRRLPARLTWAFVCVAITCAALAQRTGFIIDGVSTNAGASFYVGDTNPFNFLLITNGGTLMDQTGIIGNTESAPNNVAIVSGVGSHWNSDSNLFVGLSGSWNRLEVVAGGLVNMDGVVYPHEAIYVGYNVSSSDNSVLVKGTDSVLGRAKFYLGYSGSGNRIDLLDGGRIESTHTSGLGSGWPSYIGFSVSSSSNTAFVSGTNSVWNSDHLYLGFAGSQNSLVIAGGGKVACAVLYVGYETSSHRNGLLVTGTNSTWIGQLRIGGGSSNNVVVNAGA